MRGAGSHALNPARRAQANFLTSILLVGLAVLLFGNAASAQTNVYTIRGNVGGNNNIWTVNLATNVETRVLTGYPGGNAASLAQRPSDGMLFYAINGTNGGVYTFNPATPNVAPQTIGNLGPTALGVNVSGGFRMAFNGNTLYYMVGDNGAGDANTVYTLDQNTGRATKIATVTNTTDGGDIAFQGNTLYVIDQNLRLCTYAGLPANGAASGCNTLAIANNRSIGLAFNSSNQLLLQTVNTGADTSSLYSVTGPSFITALSGLGQATGDMASANVPAPNLSITKTDNLSSVYRGGPVRYTIVVTNNGTYPVTGTVVDTVPATVTGVTWTCAATLPSFCGAASGAGNNINTTATLAAGASATYTFTAGTLSAAASGTLINTATVAVPGWLTDATPGNNTATDTDDVYLNANLAITKTDGVANITAGNVVTYTVVVSNAGPDASNGSVVTDTVPAAVSTVTWTCGTPTGGATCGAASGSGNAISTTADLPSGSTLRYTVTGTLSVGATGTLANTATIVTPATGVSDPTDLNRTGAGNNSATDTDTITAIPYVKPQKSVSPSGPSQPPGTVLVYTITFTNIGGAPAQSLVITDPFSTSTDFKLGSESHVAPVAVNVAYWDIQAPGPPQWVAVPTSDGSAPAGYARNITKIRWTFAANLAPGASATLTFSVRIP